MRPSRILLSTVLGVLLVLSGDSFAQTHHWQSGPDMSTGRYHFPLVELPSGDWLAAGGVFTGNSFGATVEVLDRVASAWTTVSPMPSAHRGGYGGVRLLSGEVLIAGEDPHVGGHPHPRSAYRFDEAGGTWTRTANDPTIDRFSATLTLLPDSRVLHAGGYSGHGTGPTYHTADLYDPGTDSWSATGTMAEVRAGHTATLLTVGPAAGEVLVVGGSDRAPNNTATSGCELYDPATGAWSATGSLNESRSLHTATLLPSGQVLVVGGQSALGAVNRSSAELYDPENGTWSLTAPMTMPRALQSATLLLSGEVLVAGGIAVSGDNAALRSTEIYDPLADTWSADASMANPRGAHSAARLPDGRVIVVGGLNGTPLAGTEIFTPGDSDRDGDGVPDDEDNCPDDANPDQSDLDGDLLGDVCDEDDDNDDVGDTEDVCDQTSIPELVPTVRLGVNRFALHDSDTGFDTTPPKGGGSGPRRSFSTTDTAGCSCEQIIDALGLGQGHRKFGCSISAMEAWVAVVNP